MILTTKQFPTPCLGMTADHVSDCIMWSMGERLTLYWLIAGSGSQSRSVSDDGSRSSYTGDA